MTQPPIPPQSASARPFPLQMRSGRRVFFVVMGNVFPIDRPVHERYDLKGSTRGRVTSEEERKDPNVVLKDLDWIRAGRKLHLGDDKKRRLLAQVSVTPPMMMSRMCSHQA